MAESNSTKKKRRVKDPVTFRERAQKATTSKDKPKNHHSVAKNIFKPVGVAFRAIGKVLNVVFNRKPFTYLKKPLSIIEKILLIPYLKNSWQELRLVTWLSWKQSIRLTFAVIVFAAIFGLMIAGIDYVLDKIFRQILLS